MQEFGLTFMAEESCWEWEPHHGYELAMKLLKQGPRPRALLCLNDRLSLGAYQALADAGLRVPSDVSVVSFDDDIIASYLRPGLTTIGLPHDEMGREAVRQLLLQDSAAQVLIPMPVVERASIRPVW